MLINVSLSEQKHGRRKQETEHTLTGAFSLPPEDTSKSLKNLHQIQQN